jgi:threonine aldolase
MCLAACRLHFIFGAAMRRGGIWPLIAAVTEVLRSDWLTTGPAVAKFETALAEAVGANDAVACNSGTAALYLAVRASQLQPGDAVVVPAITFVATANAAVLAGFRRHHRGCVPTVNIVIARGDGCVPP